jgi:hypothetical protein
MFIYASHAAGEASDIHCLDEVYNLLLCALRDNRLMISVQDNQLVPS